ncbi:hypothetical protein OBBRIDRAFT_692514, partial [Obba rivulosa]
REQDYTTDKSKIMMALSHMAGDQVDEWKNNLAEFWQNQQRTNPNWNFPSWNDFILNLQGRWGPIDLVTAASTKLIALQYDPGDRIDSFIVKFENLAMKAGINEDAALLPMFRLKLPAPMRMKI